MKAISISAHERVAIADERTLHFAYERQERFDFIKTHIGMGEVLYSFLVDKGHPRGPKIESITDTGIVILQTQDTNEIITLLVAKPSQIMMYWEALNQPIPIEIRKVITKAREHQMKGWNFI